jgi:hypothetical protein
VKGKWRLFGLCSEAYAARSTGHSERNEADEILLAKRPRDRRVEVPTANNAKLQDFSNRISLQSPPPTAAIMLFFPG